MDLLFWHLRNEHHHIKLKSKSPNYVFGSVRVYEVTAKGTELACTSSQGLNPSQSQSITAIPGRSFIYFLYIGPNCCSPFGPQHVHYIRFDKTNPFGRSTFQPASHLLKVARIWYMKIILLREPVTTIWEYFIYWFIWTAYTVRHASSVSTAHLASNKNAELNENHHKQREKSV